MRKAIAAVAFALLLAAGCGSTGAHVDVSGNAAVSRAELDAAMAGCRTVDECEAAIYVEYFDRGYLDAKTRAERSWLQRWSGSKGATVVVTEGSLYRIKNVVVVETGGPFADTLRDDAVARNAMRPGDIARGGALRDLVNGIAEHYREAGFADVMVLPRTDVDPGTATLALELEITRGAQSATR